MAGLVAHQGPGNVRDLQNVVERAAILTEDGAPITAELMGLATPMPATMAAPLVTPAAPAPAPAPTAFEATAAPLPSNENSAPGEVVPLHEMEKRAILNALHQTNGNRTQAAEMLQISIRTLRNKLAEYREAGVELETLT
jgi:DNA-binding NtrC family response regulator